MENIVELPFYSTVAQNGNSKIVLCNVVTAEGAILTEIWVFHHSMGTEFTNMKEAWENYVL